MCGQVPTSMRTAALAQLLIVAAALAAHHRKCLKTGGWYDMTGKQAMDLEIAALTRLNKCCPTGPFPQLVNTTDTCWTTSGIGTKLPEKGIPYGTLSSSDHRRLRHLITLAADCMKRCRVRHLDIMCKNMALSQTPLKFELFDFDLSMIDNHPQGSEIKNRAKRTHGVARCEGGTSLGVDDIAYREHFIWFAQLCLGMLFGEPADYVNARSCGGHK